MKHVFGYGVSLNIKAKTSFPLVFQPNPKSQNLSAGIYVSGYDVSLNVRNSFPVFSTMIEANHVNKKDNAYSMLKLTDDDRKVSSLKKPPRLLG